MVKDQDPSAQISQPKNAWTHTSTIIGHPNNVYTYQQQPAPVHHHNRGFLFFGHHDRVEPINNNDLYDQTNEKKEPFDDDKQKILDEEIKKTLDGGFGKKKIPIDDDVKKQKVSGNNKKSDPNSKKSETKPKKPKLSLRERIVTAWADEESNLRLSWPIFAIILLSLIGAAIFLGVEASSCNWDYWECVYFMNTIFTTIVLQVVISLIKFNLSYMQFNTVAFTQVAVEGAQVCESICAIFTVIVHTFIGYGTPAPCTTGGKITAIIMALIGIPVNVYALANLGRILARFLHYTFVSMESCYRRLKRRLSEKNKNAVKLVVEHAAGESPSEDVPLSYALFMAVLWFIICASFFHLTEPDNMDFGNAFYFVMISVTTIGFGDVQPWHYNLVVFQFFFIIIGIALFSMMINIVNDKVDSLSTQVETMISKEYMNAQLEGTKLETDEIAARNHIRNIMKQQKGGGLLQMVMGKGMENKLVEDYLSKARKNIKGTQTDNEVKHVEVTAFPEMKDFTIMVLPSQSFEMKDKSTQLRWMPKTFNNVDWLDLMYPSRQTSQTKPVTRFNPKRKK